MKLRFNLSILLIIIINGCTNSPIITESKPKANLVSTFDVSLDQKDQKDLESQFDSVLDPKNLDEWMKHMSSKPHHVGSPWSKQNAEYVVKHFKSWGLEASIETFEVLVPFPKVMKLELIEPKKVSLKLNEPALKEDATSRITKDVLPLSLIHI